MSDEVETKNEEAVDFAETPERKQEHLSKLKDELKEKYGNNFDEKKFDTLTSGLSTDKLKNIDKNLFKKSKDDDNGNNDAKVSAGDFHFSWTFKDGQFVAKSPDGTVVKGNDLDEFHKALAQKFKEKFARDNNPNGKTTLTLGKRDEVSAADKKHMESFARIFINEGVAVAGDVPQDPKFWNDLKKEYLQNKENTEENWNKLTRYVPRKSMGLPEVDKKQAKTLIALSRKGYNPNLQRPPLKPTALPKNTNLSQMRLAPQVRDARGSGAVR